MRFLRLTKDGGKGRRGAVWADLRAPLMASAAEGVSADAEGEWTVMYNV
mgnify:CR=1 FL=1